MKKPNLRNSYLGEASRAVGLSDLYQQSVDQEISYLDYNLNGLRVWALSRKAGLLGGMIPIESENYYEQPGIVDMCFKLDGQLRYTEISVSVEGPITYVDLYYDPVTFGPTQIWSMGETGDEAEIELNHVLLEAGRHPGALQVDAQSAVNQGVEELAFEVRTRNRSFPDYVPMLNSDYEGPYNSHDKIYTNPLYQDWFTWGSPARSSGDDPHEDPLHYWPYVLPLKATITFLNKPTDATADAPSYSSINLSWEDMSGHESGYEIERRPKNAGSWTVRDSVGADVTSWTDYSVGSYEGYWYRLRAYGEGIYSDYSDSTFEYAIPMWSRTPEALEHNNGQKLCQDAGIPLCAVYADSGQIWYKESLDGGQTWVGKVRLTQPLESYPADHDQPALALDNSNRRCVVWRSHWNQPWWQGDEVTYQFSTTDGTWSPDEPYGIYRVEGDSISTPSIAVDDQDSVHIVWKRHSNSRDRTYIEYCGFPSNSPPPTIVTPVVVDSSEAGSEARTVLVRHPSAVIGPSGVPTVGWERHLYLPSKAEGVTYYVILTRQLGGDTCLVWQCSEEGLPTNVRLYPCFSSGAGGTILAAWQCSLKDSVYFSSDAGNGWSSPERVSSVSTDYAYPVAAKNDVHTAVTWQDAGEIYYSQKGAGEWSTPVNVSQTSSNSSDPHAVFSPDGYYNMIWTDGNVSPYELLFRRPEYMDVTFVRGDANDDGRITIADASLIVSYIYRGTPVPCKDACDAAEPDGRITIADANYLVDHIYRGGPPPPYPYPDCGPDPTPDELDCGSHTHCPGMGKGPLASGSPEYGGTMRLGEPIVTDGRLLLPVYLENVRTLHSFAWEMTFEPKALILDCVENRGMITEKFDFFDYVRSDEEGWIKAGALASWTMEQVLPSGTHQVATLVFKTRAEETENTPLPRLTYVELVDPRGNILDAGTGGGAMSSGSHVRPYVFALLQSRPNPFATEATISYSIAKNSQVTLEIYDSSGRLVRTLVNEQKQPGRYATHWDGTTDRDGHVAAGVYFYKMIAGEFTSVKKMVLLR